MIPKELNDAAKAAAKTALETAKTMGEAYVQYLQRENAKVHAQAVQAWVEHKLKSMWGYYFFVALIVVDAMQTVAQYERIVAPKHIHLENPYNTDEQLVKQIYMNPPIILKNGIFMYRFHGRKYADCKLSAKALCKELQIEIDKATDWHGFPRLVCNVTYYEKNSHHYVLHLALKSDYIAELNRRKYHAKFDV